MQDAKGLGDLRQLSSLLQHLHAHQTWPAGADPVSNLWPTQPSVLPSPAFPLAQVSGSSPVFCLHLIPHLPLVPILSFQSKCRALVSGGCHCPRPIFVLQVAVSRAKPVVLLEGEVLLRDPVDLQGCSRAWLL